jgi:hypothetical protein
VFPRFCLSPLHAEGVWAGPFPSLVAGGDLERLVGNNPYVPQVMP